MEDQVLRSQFEIFACLCAIADETKDAETTVTERIENEDAQINI